MRPVALLTTGTITGARTALAGDCPDAVKAAAPGHLLAAPGHLLAGNSLSRIAWPMSE
jgi:hypothetical protein